MSYEITGSLSAISFWIDTIYIGPTAVMNREDTIIEAKYNLHSSTAAHTEKTTAI